MITTTTTHTAHLPRPGLRPSDSARCARLARFRLAAFTRLAAWPWHRPALGAVLALTALLNFWHLDRLGYANTYYAAAVKSMLQSWHNFFFVSFDPGGFVSIDKPPLGFWIETASARLFGFSGLSLLLPEALAGVLSVAVLYRLVARVWGRGPGLLAALFLAVTPVSVVTARNNTIDSLLVLTVLLAAWAVARAVGDGPAALAAAVRGPGRAGLQHQDARGLPGGARLRPGLPDRDARELAQAPRPPGPGHGRAAGRVAVVGHGG